MIKTMLRPFFKRFIGLFISMAFVSLLSIALLCSFGSTIVNLERNYRSYLHEYGEVDEQITITGVTSRDKMLEATQVDGVENVDTRLTLDTYLKKKDDGRTIVARVFSFNEETNTVFKRYVLESAPKKDKTVNISVCRKFALNNGFTIGSTIQLGFLDIYANFHISEIIETAEGIYPRANDYVWSDNHDFGYIYIDEYELDRWLIEASKMVREAIISNPAFEAIYEDFISSLGVNFPDIRDIDENSHFVQEFANQILVKNKAKTSQDDIMDKISANLENGGVTIKTATTGDMLPYRVYMSNAIRQVRIASLFLPIFFYSVTMIVIGLFMNQIIKAMTNQIGIFLSIGISKWQIIGLLLTFGALMAVVAGVLGVPVGYGLSVMLKTTMAQVYSIPVLTANIDIFIGALAIGGLLIFAELATFLSCLAIFRITPKDATISNESKRKKIPKWLDRAITKAPMTTKLSVNSIAQNPRRFFVSIFSMFASLVLITLASFFYVSKEAMISQSIKGRLNYDCQVYLTSKASQSFIDDLSIQTFIEKDKQGNPQFEDCYYTYIPIITGKNRRFLEVLAVDTDASSLISIPNSNGNGSLHVQDEGLILSKTDADALKVKKGDSIKLYGKDVKIVDISFQYFHPMTYLSKEQLQACTNQYVSTFILNIANDANAEQQFLTYMSENEAQALTVFTRSLAQDLYGVFDTINIFIYILIAFSLGMSFIILTIMSQNALMEQQRQLSVLRAVGFRIIDISNIWTIQSLSQLVLAAIIGIPSGCLASIILFRLASGTAQTYPFILSWPVIFMAIGFVILVVLACHLISMITIRRWNLADNTRCRE